jgi:hypothetical protein
MRRQSSEGISGRSPGIKESYWYYPMYVVVQPDIIDRPTVMQ